MAKKLSPTALKAYLRVIKRRVYENGEDLEEVLASYHALSEADKQWIRDNIDN